MDIKREIEKAHRIAEELKKEKSTYIPNNVDIYMAVMVLSGRVKTSETQLEYFSAMLTDTREIIIQLDDILKAYIKD